MNDDLTVVIDTREQWPLVFNCPTVRGTLHTGDYSVQGYEIAAATKTTKLLKSAYLMKKLSILIYTKKLINGL